MGLMTGTDFLILAAGAFAALVTGLVVLAASLIPPGGDR